MKEGENEGDDDDELASSDDEEQRQQRLALAANTSDGDDGGGTTDGTETASGNETTSAGGSKKKKKAKGPRKDRAPNKVTAKREIVNKVDPASGLPTEPKELASSYPGQCAALLRETANINDTNIRHKLKTALATLLIKKLHDRYEFPAPYNN